MNQHQPVFMPFPWMGPPQHQPPPTDEKVPRRVAVAMEVYSRITNEMCVQLAGNDVGFHEVDGRKLEVEERETFSAACKLLTTYLRGEYQRSKVEQDDIKENKKQEKAKWSFIRCPACHGRTTIGGVKCELCEGHGSLQCKPCSSMEE